MEYALLRKHNRSIDPYRDACLACVGVVLILIPYYLAVQYIGYPYAKEPALSIAFRENLFRQALGEEALYRLIPLALTVRVYGRNMLALTAVIALTSVVFAIGHNGYASIPAVAPGAVVLSVAFLYFGGLAGNEFRAYFWTTGIHVLANLSIFSVIPAFI